MITFVVPGSPQGKGRPRVGTISGRARVFTPAKTVAYEGLIAHAAQQAMAGRPLIDGPVSCAIAIDAPIPASWSKRKQAAALAGELMPTTRPDLDNVVKAIFDGCNGVLWCDDAQIVDLSVRKRYAATPGVRVTRLTHPLYALPPDLAEYLLRHLQQERAALDGFLRLGNEKPRAKRLDAWIACLAGPNVGAKAPT